MIATVTDSTVSFPIEAFPLTGDKAGVAMFHRGSHIFEFLENRGIFLVVVTTGHNHDSLRDATGETVGYAAFAITELYKVHPLTFFALRMELETRTPIAA